MFLLQYRLFLISASCLRKQKQTKRQRSLHHFLFFFFISTLLIFKYRLMICKILTIVLYSVSVCYLDVIRPRKVHV